MNQYGDFFKSLRRAKRLTLREVEEQAGVSNAYLSQLENNKVKQPSPNVLFKLSEIYDVPYESLMEKVGYPVSNSRTQQEGKTTIHNRFGTLSEDEEESMLQYLAFIRKQNKKK